MDLLANITPGATALLTGFYDLFLVKILDDAGTILLAIFTLIVGLKTARAVMASNTLTAHQIRVNALSQNRQDWINNVRNASAEMVAYCAMLHTLIRQSDDGIDAPLAAEHADLKKTAQALHYKIAMMLNPDKPDQKALLDALDECVSGIQSPKGPDTTAVILSGQQLFKNTWVQIKEELAVPEQAA